MNGILRMWMRLLTGSNRKCELKCSYRFDCAAKVTEQPKILELRQLAEQVAALERS